jgi:hypothetical protein
MGLNRAIFSTSDNYEVSAAPCTHSEPERAPSRGVAETLLHETAGRESSLWGFGVNLRHDDCHSLWLRWEPPIDDGAKSLTPAQRATPT